MKAYKVFNQDWTCRNFQYQINKTYKLLDDNNNLLSPIKCERGFHACEKLKQCFGYYDFDPLNKVAVVELSGEIISDEDKVVCNTITIVEELSWEKVLTLVNTGIGNTGRYNSGDNNSGSNNTGNRNAGHKNSGDSNSGNWNTGNKNSGIGNTGHRNSGHRNSGDWNSGNKNSGDWNSGNLKTGYFNSISPTTFDVFNVPTDMEFWSNSKKPRFIYNIVLSAWVDFIDMTDDEKISNPKASINKGYNRQFSYKEAWKNAFDNRNKNDLELLKALPNFNAAVFEEISGINVNDY